MKTLIADIEQAVGKTAWQTYLIKHGFESIKVAVPLKNSAVFEESLSKQTLHSRSAVLSFVHQHGGELI